MLGMVAGDGHGWGWSHGGLERLLRGNVPDPVAVERPVKGKSTEGGDDEDREQRPYRCEHWSLLADVAGSQRFCCHLEALLGAAWLSVRFPAIAAGRSLLTTVGQSPSTEKGTPDGGHY